MKKFFEKHDLIKLTGICVLLVVILSWIISSGYYTSGVISYDVINRIGIFDLTTYSLLTVMYYFLVFMFIFVVSGFYKFLGSLDAYDSLTSKIASVFKGKEKLFVALSTLIFACLSGISTEHIVLLAIIPFAITILSKLKVDKISGLIATFGGILIGILGATYSTSIVGHLADTSYGLSVSYGFELITVIVLFAITYLLLTYFAFARMNKAKANSEIALLEDPFARPIKVEEETKGKKKVKKERKVSTVGLSILLIITFVVIILAFIGWNTAFGVEAFTDAYNWTKEATIFDQEIFAYILGIHEGSNVVQNVFVAFGSWDLLLASGVILLSSLLIKLVYHVPFDKMLDEFGEGFKKSGKTVFVALMVYVVWILSVVFPTMPSLVAKITEGLGTNIGTLFASGALTSFFVVDFQYVVSMVGSLYANFTNVNVAALILQTSYGIIQFIAPTSLILMVGLSMLNVKFKDYFKFIWKFLLAMLVVVIIILAILMYV